MQNRSSYLGASEAAAVLGLCPWRTPYQVWLEKTGRSGPQPETIAMRLGSYLESFLLEWAEQRLGPLERGKEFIIDNTLIVHPDGITVGGQPVEAKTAGLTSNNHDPWGEEGTDLIPEYYRCQVHIQLAATGADVAFVPALIAGRGVCMFQVPARPTLQQALVEKLCQWWQRHVLADLPPEQDATPEKDMFRGERVTLTDPHIVELIDRREQLLTQQKELEAEINRLKNEIVSYLGDAEAAELPDGRLITYIETVRKAYTVPESRFRTLKVTRRK